MTDPTNRFADEREHETTGGRLAAMLVLAVVLVLGVNALAVRRSPWKERTHDGRTVHTKWDLASEGAPASWLIRARRAQAGDLRRYFSTSSPSVFSLTNPFLAR